ncbi:hypothetical protein [Photobacterium damselae]|uniref:hypothetical protein n=1 Tax=Photobacterium damselae TaxID=38293 RepID=UPI00406955AC
MKKILLAFFLFGVSISSHATGSSSCESLGGKYISYVYANTVSLDRFYSQDKATNSPKGLFNKEKEFNGVVTFQYKESSYNPRMSLNIKNKELYDDMLAIKNNSKPNSMKVCYDESSMTLLGYGVQ